MEVDGGDEGPSVSITSDNQSQNQQNTGDNQNSSTENNQNSAPSFAAALNEDNRAYFTKKGWREDPNEIVKSYRELETLHSKKSAQQTTQQNNQSEQTQSNVPANASDYTFKLPEGIPAEGFYDNKLADTFKGWAHKAKLSPDQAQALHDEWTKHSFSTFQTASGEQAKNLNTRISNSHDDLVKTWGAPETPAFQRNIEMARRAMNHLDPGLKQALKDTGVLIDQKDKSGKVQEVVANATILKALAKVGSGMFVEDNMFGSRPQGENPFDPKYSGADVMKRQGEIIKNDRELAKTLIRAAGVEKDWRHMF